MNVGTQEFAACGVRAKARIYAVGTQVAFRGRYTRPGSGVALTVLKCSNGRFAPVRRLRAATDGDGSFHGSFVVHVVSDCYVEVANGPRAYFVVRQPE